MQNPSKYLKKSTNFNHPTKTNNESLDEKEEEGKEVKYKITPIKDHQLADFVSPHSDSVLTNSGSFLDDSMSSE